MVTISIGGRKIGDDFPCFIIAEAGINHNGDINIAKKMIDVAKNCGVDAVKFQTFKAEEFVSDKKQTYTYETQGRKITESMYKMFKRHELTRKGFQELAVYCKKRGITFFSTPQNISDLDLLIKIGVPIIKVGSDDLTNFPLLKNYAKRGLPLIISTGMSYFSEVAEAVEIIEKLSDKVIILLCVSSYPADFEEINLNRIKTLKLAFPNTIIGYSDHTLGTTAAIGAVTLGAKAIEKHFTLDHGMFGPDHRFSANPDELKQLVKDIRNAEKTLGSPEIRPSLREQKMRKLCRRSIVAYRNIQKGSSIREKDLAFKRPGQGIPPKNLNFIIGRKTKRNISKDQLIQYKDLS